MIFGSGILTPTVAYAAPSEDVSGQFDEYGRPRVSRWEALFGSKRSPEKVRAYRSSSDARAAARHGLVDEGFSVQLSAAVTDIDAGTRQAAVDAEVQILSRVEINVGYAVYSESPDSSHFLAAGIGLPFGSITERVRLVPGVSAVRFDGQSGAAATGRLEVLPGPFVLRAEGELGRVGERGLRGASFQVGFRPLASLEAFVAWGGRSIGEIDLFGPRAGLRVWI